MPIFIILNTNFTKGAKIYYQHMTLEITTVVVIKLKY